MPRGDGTGPQGMGPMTGRAAGYCIGSGRGWGRKAPFITAYNPAPVYYGYPYQSAPETEKELLASEAEALKEQLGFLEKRISELESIEKKRD